MSDLDAPTMGDFLAKWILPSPAPDEYAGIRELCEALGIDPGESPHAVASRLAAPDTIEHIFAELRDRGWAGGEYKSVEIHLEHDGVRVELDWVNRPETTNAWGHATEEIVYEEQPTLLKALQEILVLAEPDPPEDV